MDVLLGTRASALALRQAHLVRERLARAGARVGLTEIQTTGDRILDVPLADVGDKALFTRELDLALLDRSIRIAVHSLKDLPTQLLPGIVIGAVVAREDPRDAFIAHPTFDGTLADLPRGATLATSSLRRRAQLKAWRTDLNVVSIRGNVDTRLRKLDESDWEGIILASAGLLRLGIATRIREAIDTHLMLPAAGQGALAVVCNADDRDVLSLLQTTLHDEATERVVVAERAFLRRLEGGCSVPIGALGRITAAETLVLEGSVTALDGSMHVRGEERGHADRASEIGTALATRLLEEGASELLDEVRLGH